MGALVAELTRRHNSSGTFETMSGHIYSVASQTDRHLHALKIVTVRPLASADSSAILRINASHWPAVASLDHAELDRLLALSDAHRVAVAGDAVVGYMLVFARHSAYDGEEFQHFRAQLPDPFLYVDQVAVEPAHRRMGIGRRLYQALLELAGQQPIAWLCCEVNLRPPNPASLDFHRRLGFTVMGNGDTLDGRRVAFLARKL
jgi:uncharacterized protein